MAKKTAIYIRISTQLQYTDRQKEELIQLANYEGYEVIDVYTDILSGFKDDEHRPELKRLLEDSKLNKFNLVLFSEFSRLSRKVSDLTKFIEEFQENNIELYFQKQNQWVRKSNDLGTRILIQVLGVVSEYEIELFKERSISGKISAVKNRGINLGGLTAYGYKSEEGTKKLIIDTTEAKTVQRIFQMYSEGKTAQHICDVLNSEGISSPYAKRLPDSISKRKEKGISDKDYKKFDVGELVWIASSLNKIIKNPLYIGKRSINIKRKNADGVSVYEAIEFEQNESIRIIDDNLYHAVQLKLKENTLKRDTAVKHPTLLKSILNCGCCGRNFVSSKANGTYRYMCFGKIKDTKTREVNCKSSLEYAQYKLDGLVIQMVLYRLADNNYQLNVETKLEKLNSEIFELQSIVFQKKGDLNAEEIRWGEYIKKALKFNVSDAIISLEENIHQTTITQLSSDIERTELKLSNIRKQIGSLNSITENKGIYTEMNKIRNDKNLLKQLIDEYVESVTPYPVFDKYSLVIVALKDGSEVWGTIKSSKYKNEELWYNGVYITQPDYIYQLLVNDDKIAEYKPETNSVYYSGKTKTQEYIVGEPSNKVDLSIIPKDGMNPIIKLNNEVSEETYETETLEVPYLKIQKGEYPIKDFIELLKQNDMNGNFSSYDFHSDEVDNEANKQKDIAYREKASEKKNARARELRKIRKNNNYKGS